jgi:tripartite-type tricarboxylate transporter receptor subunit TctC
MNTVKTMAACSWGVAFLALSPLAAQAQEWPQRPVTIVVGYGPASSPDLMARTLAEGLRRDLGQPFVVENRAGAGGNIGLEPVAAAGGDGHVLGVTTKGPLVVNPLTMAMGFDPRVSIAPVTIIGTHPLVLAVSPSLGAASIRDLVELLKRNPGKYNYASIGIGSISHIAMELLAQQGGAEMTHLPFKASPDAIRAVVAGEAHMAALAPSTVTGLAQAGKLRLLAVTTPERWKSLSDVPTFREAGLSEVQTEGWVGLVASAKTPAALVSRIQRAARAVLLQPAVVEEFRKQHYEPVANTPAEFTAFLQAEEKRLLPIVKKVMPPQK